jgi:hypothetical protein
MIGYFIKKGEEGLRIMLIPYNLVVYEKGNILDISFDVNMLENLNLNFIKDKEEGNLERDLKEGKVQTIDVENSYLKEIQGLIEENKAYIASKKALELYKFVKSINQS